LIIDPHFLDHWKTQLLIGLLDDERAPIYVLRLWSHCQIRKRWEFDNLPPSALKAICHFTGDETLLKTSLLKSKFCRKSGKTIIVHEWDVYNKRLIHNWLSGALGGRPKNPRDKEPKKTKKNPRDTHSVTDKRREDKIRVNKEQKWTPLMFRFAAIFNRQRTTKFSPKEIAAINKILPVNEDDLRIVERFYATDYEYTRDSLGTLLNNFPSEVDKAANYFRKKSKLKPRAGDDLSHPVDNRGKYR
jgi:hypothetical protein